MKTKILLFSCLLAATFADAAQPPDTCQDNTPISGSDNWWSCNWSNTYTCGGFCCCENRFQPEESGYCVSCPAAPVNCVMNDWQNSGDCSATCGDGLQTQTRSVQTPTANGGTTCPASSRTIPCSTTACPVNCVMNDWQNSGDCSATCGDGLQTQTRSVQTRAANGGTTCPASSRTIPCSTTACPSDASLQCGSSVSGSTRGRASQVGHSSGEATFEFTPSDAGVVTFDLCDSEFDTYLRILDSSGSEVAANDDHSTFSCPGHHFASYLEVSLQPGQTYTVLIEGYLDAEGDYALDVICGNQDNTIETCSTCRIRRNWNGMEDDEKKEYIDTVNIARTEEPYKSQYDALVMSHGQLASSGIHGQVQFLAWHRWFIFEYENLLRQITPCITVPYWAWEVAGDNWHQDEIWGTEDHQFGSCGRGDVNDGPFSDMILPGTNVPLSRNCRSGSSLPKISDLDFLHESPDDFLSFFHGIDSVHGWVHMSIGGSMGRIAYSGMTPEFFLHHNNVDRIWTNWQLESESHELAQPSRDATLSGTDSTYIVDDFTRARDQAGTCVEYEDHIVDTSGRRRLSAQFTKVNLAVAISNQLPKDVAFRNLLVHTNELSLQVSEDFEAERLMFAANQRGESLSDERAHEIAHLHQENSNWGKYIRERQVDTEYVPDSEAKAFFTDIVGITAESVRHALETTHKFEGLQAFDRQWTEFEELFAEN